MHRTRILHNRAKKQNRKEKPANNSGFSTAPQKEKRDVSASDTLLWKGEKRKQLMKAALPEPDTSIQHEKRENQTSRFRFVTPSEDWRASLDRWESHSLWEPVQAKWNNWRQYYYLNPFWVMTALKYCFPQVRSVGSMWDVAELPVKRQV